jgi:hypothetical protein
VWNSGGDGSGGGISPDSIPLPSYQSGLANSANGGSSTLRDGPDIAMEADFDNYNCAEGGCAGDWAGTSFATPRWAGFIALVNQQAVEAGTAPAGGIGFLNPPLYQLAQGSNASSDLHDIVSGNNDTENQPVSYSAVVGYDLTTGWGSPTGQSLINDLAGQQAPGFWLSTPQSMVQTNPGGTGTATIRITDAGSFSGNVNLAVTSTLPSGVTASFASSSTTASDTLTFTVNSAVAPQNIPITVAGTAGSLTQNLALTLSINNPSFSLAAAPSSLIVAPGSTTTSTITVLPQYGFTGNVGLTISGLPSGVTASFSPTSTKGTSTLTLTASASAVGGVNTLTITGTSGSLTATTSVSLAVSAPSFELEVTSSTVVIGKSSSMSTFIEIYPQYGFTGNVTLAATNLPSGVTATFSINPATSYSQLTLTTSSTAALGTGTITITGTSGNITASSTLTLQLVPPSFTLTTYNVTSALGQGGSTSSSVYVQGLYGFSGNVNLSVTGLPNGVTPIWSVNPATSNSTLYLYATSSAPVGQYPLTITGTSGTITATTTMNLTVSAPTFSMSSPGTITMGAGSSSTAYGYIQRLYGFTGNVALSIAGLPSGVTASFTPNSLSGTNTSYDITFQANSSVVIGQYPLTITGTSGSQTATATMTLAIVAPSFSLYGGNYFSIAQGASSSGYIDVEPNYGFTGSVNFSVSGLPSGVTASFSPNPTTGTSSLLTLNVSNTAPVGQYTLIVTGTSGTQSQTTNVSLAIGTASFTLSPSSLTVGQGESLNSYVYINDSYGFNGAVTLSLSGLPSGVTATFQTNPTTYSSQITFNVASTVPVGQYPITITGISGSLTTTTTFTLSVGTPSFTLFAASSPTIGQGSTGIGYVYVEGQNGFSNSVNLSISGLPSGVTASFQQNPTTYNSEILFTVASTATPGSSNLTITGTYGAVTQTTTMGLTVAAPTFSLYGSYNVSLNQGSSATSTVTVQQQYGFTGNVTLSASGLPSGVTATFSPNPTTGSSTVTFTASATAPSANSVVTITGTSGSITSSAQIQLQVNAGSFSLTGAPATLSIAPGSSGKSTIVIVPVNGFMNSVSLSASGLPAGVTAAISSATATTSSVLTFAVGSSAATGSSTVTITGTSGTETASTFLALNISGAPQAATSTSLSFAVNGSPVTTVTTGTAVTATAVVIAGSTPLSSGQVYLCAATAAYCDMIHEFAVAQLNSSGTGVFKFVPGAGVQTYKAVFAGTGTFAGSNSAATPLTVTASLPTATTLSQSGSAGNYTLTSTVTGQGDVAPTGNVSFVDTNASNDILASVALISKSATVTQKAGQTISVGAYPTPIVSADFNGDGIPDLAVASTSNSTVSILLGSSSGNFAAGTTLQLGAASASLAVGDFNRDGKMDLATVNQSNDTITIYSGNGDGTFTLLSTPVYTLPQPGNILVVDVNGDGLLDIVVLSQSTDSVEVLLGHGDGTFTPSNFSASAGNSPQSVVIADFNGDGIPDLVIANYSYPGTLTILLGNGDGSFTTAPSIPTAAEPYALAVGDFNQDGKPDLAVGTNIGPGPLSIYLGNGDGTFALPTVALANSNPGSIAVTDVNNDGKPDLVVEDSYNVKLWTLLGNGDGTFTTGSSVPLGSQTGNLVVGDWNGDGVPDAAVLSYYSSSVETFLTQLSQTATATASKVSPFGTGQHLIGASYAGDTSYVGSTSSTVTLTAAAGPPVVTVTSPASAQTTQPFTVNVHVSAGQGYPVPTGTVTLKSGSYTSGVMTLSSGSASFSVPAGTLPAGSNTLTVNYTPDTASAVTYTNATGMATIVVNAITPTITWATPVPINYGTALSATQLNATASVAGTFTYNPASGAMLLPGQQTLSLTFTPTDTADYATVTASVTLTVNDVASSFSVIGIPAQVDPGVTYSATVTALGVLGTPYTSFTGTVTLSSSPSAVFNPISYTFTASNAGAHTFQVTFPAAGTYSVTTTSGSITGAQANILALDYIWLVNGNGTLSQLDAAGNAISSAAGYSGGGSASGPAVIDAGGNVWSLNSSANAVVEYTSTGAPVSSGAGYTGAGLFSPAALAIDGSGQIFVANGNGSLSALSNNGTSVSPSTGYTGGNMSAPTGIAVDSSGRVWVANGNNSVTEIIGAGAAPVTTPTSTAVQSNSLGVQP